MELNAESIIWTGIVFDPCGHIRINGAKNAVLTGMIVAQTVKVDGEDFNVNKISVAGEQEARPSRVATVRPVPSSLIPRKRDDAIAPGGRLYDGGHDARAGRREH